MKTIFVAEGENHVREALCLMLEHQTGFSVVGEAGAAESALAQVCQRPPDIILLDWGIPGFHPQRMLPALRQCCPETLILVTSARPELESVARKFGVDAFLLKQLPPDQFMANLAASIRNSQNQT